MFHSEAPVVFGALRYGFFDLTMTKESIKIESINWRGRLAVAWVARGLRHVSNQRGGIQS